MCVCKYQCACVLVHACVHARVIMHTCMCICMHACACACLCTCVYARVLVRVCTCMSGLTCACACLRTCVYACVHVCLCTCVHACLGSHVLVHACVNVHIYAHMQVLRMHVCVCFARVCMHVHACGRAAPAEQKQTPALGLPWPGPCLPLLSSSVTHQQPGLEDEPRSLPRHRSGTFRSLLRDE